MQTRSNADAVLPPATIGILGGGQLGRMMALAGRQMGYRFRVLDPTPDAPAAQVADGQVVAAYDDVDAARRLASQCHLVTYEFENVSAAVAAALAETCDVPQGSELLSICQHRVREKSTLAERGLPVTPFLPISSLRDLDEAFERFDGRMVVKTCRGGYDGKGQWMVRSREQLETYARDWTRAIDHHRAAGFDDHPLIAEAYVPFEGELSVIVARNRRGEVRAFPPAENIHKRHILHMSIVPARYAEDVIARAEEVARQVAESLGVVGLIAVEMFVTGEREILINELAPRPHNSGHYTLDTCATSQFEQHVRAICNLPLGDVKLYSPVVMVNVLGQHVEPLLARMRDFPPQVKVHLYGKAEAKRDRKMGHVNIVVDEVSRALRWVETCGVWTDT
ncbi:MAG: 5-(carboxyamino)imidazole ribonucleotide synthase [Alicyclobacillus mali]|uniref:5-(carboxyamino)imidazole ribonucleotide synthase n=1 Tax=Alicyclobacillus mali (ex Roth et al. 2021) TaxID=1123961 RepID=UPI000831F020|nr:5-(carboxyamino)imidazole ribonucleotide synthase [Alicyclobacillus mali (ex Roth et al. 2021)]MCL6488479.1 5-(carboxyamino)imidazole ribonucleotide synthase [Alicyclobacillus mali (ex Roth et al. 2021)]